MDEKQTTVWMNFNINERVRVKLTQLGRDALKKQHDEFWNSVGRPGQEYLPPREDAEGWSEWQLWILMERLGHFCSLCADPPFDTEIQFRTRKEVSQPEAQPSIPLESLIRDVTQARRDLARFGFKASYLDWIIQVPPLAQTEPKCTRSHPHENMNAECEALTIKARADNAAAQKGSNSP